MNLRLIFTLLISKVLIRMCRLVKLGGTTLPGKVARKIHPEAVKFIAKKFRIIMVTGTNGKTTTTRIIGQILQENGMDYVTNKSGANLISGITTTFIDSINLAGKIKASTALIEIDEAAFNAMSDFIEPDILVVTNFFRDQLDRYGELYTTLKNVKTGIQKLKNTKLVLNADDSLCASLGRDTDKEVIYYGIDANVYKNDVEPTGTDAVFCLYCKSRYIYSNRIYAHLGGFKCPECGYEKPLTNVTCTGIDELNNSYSDIQLSISTPYQQSIDMELQFRARINLPGLYNIYNSLGGIACSVLSGFPSEKSIEALNKFVCGFGRMETINTEGKTIKVILVKNPTGFNQVLNYLLMESTNMQTAFLINDKLADGTDISWLWDVDFEKLQYVQEKMDNIYASGIRAEDMALRLKYAGIYTDRISMIKNYRKLVDTGLSRTLPGQNFYILPTYTAMLGIRRLLKKKFGLKEFWK